MERIVKYFEITNGRNNSLQRKAMLHIKYQKGE